MTRFLTTQIMQAKSKPRVIKDFEKLDKDFQEKVLNMYPNNNGLLDALISYTDPKTGLERFALPYETEDRYYMIRVDSLIESQIDSPTEDDDFSSMVLEQSIEKMDKPNDINDDIDDEEEEDDDQIKFVDLDEVDGDDEDDDNGDE